MLVHVHSFLITKLPTLICLVLLYFIFIFFFFSFSCGFSTFNHYLKAYVYFLQQRVFVISFSIFVSCIKTFSLQLLSVVHPSTQVKEPHVILGLYLIVQTRVFPCQLGYSRANSGIPVTRKLDKPDRAQTGVYSGQLTILAQL